MTMSVQGLTEHDLKERKDYITASDVPKLTGTSPYGGPIDVWFEKNRPVDPLQQTPAMAWGLLMEEPIIRFTEMQLREYLKDPELKATRVGIRRKHRNAVMSATLDAKIANRNESIEAKTHATVHPNVDWDAWGTDPWTDDIPPYYVDQVLAQIACAELDRVWVVLSIGRMVPIIYCVEREKHAQRISWIEETCSDFWDRHILTNTPPPGTPKLETVKRVKVPVDPALVADIPDVLLERNKRLAAVGTKIEKKKDEIRAAILHAMIGKKLGRSPKGHTITLSDVNSKERVQKAYSYQRMNIWLNVREM